MEDAAVPVGAVEDGAMDDVAMEDDCCLLGEAEATSKRTRVVSHYYGGESIQCSNDLEVSECFVVKIRPYLEAFEEGGLRSHHRPVPIPTVECLQNEPGNGGLRHHIWW